MKTFIISYFTYCGAIAYCTYKAHSEDGAIKKFRRFRDGGILRVEWEGDR